MAPTLSKVGRRKYRARLKPVGRTCLRRSARTHLGLCHI
jgi:hypothetical protein